MTLADYLKVSKKTHLIFDFDETLIKLILPWDDAIKAIKNELTALDEKTYSDYHENKISHSLLQNKYVSRFGEKILRIIIKNEIEFETNNLQDAIPNPELLDLVKNLSGYELFIWSSNTKSTIERLLKKHGIFEKFKKLVTREDVALLKPEIDGFSVLHDTGVTKENYLFIGDSEFDRIAAEKIGIDFYLVDFFSANS